MNATVRRVAVFGETLVDEFPDRAVLGGAPFNVAYHLERFGIAPLLVTRVGRDAYGDRIFEAIERAGMDTRGVQRDRDLPTGRVRITLGDGGHRFEIVDGQAYDAIDAEESSAAVRAASPLVVAFGTLAQRSATSRAALDAVLEAAACPRWLDINLREPFDTTETIRRSIEAADFLKLNDAELEIVAHRLGLPGGDPELHAAALVDEFRLQSVIVTCGAGGAWSLSAGGTLSRVEGRPLDGELADTVGAGDGFAAVCILGLLDGWAPQETLERAGVFARRLCCIRGAIPDDDGIYDGLVGPG